MHELSIALKLVDLACEHASSCQEMQVDAVHIAVGALSHIHQPSLLSGFAIAREGTLVSEAELIIRQVPLVLACTDCERDFESSGIQDLRCPVCHGYSTQVRHGNELDLEFLSLRPRQDENISIGSVSNPARI